jgi:hypothetical protein
MTANRDGQKSLRARTEVSRVSTRHALSEPGLSGAPDEPGAFWLFKAGTLIFVGHARRSLRVRLLAHLRGEEGSCTQHADQYQWETTSTPTARARTLLAEYQARFGRLPRCNDRLL